MMMPRACKSRRTLWMYSSVRRGTSGHWVNCGKAARSRALSYLHTHRR